METRRQIPFSPPDITQSEIDAVTGALRSGWITTGPRTKELERRLASLTGADGVACLSSATAAMESTLRALGIGPGDEVITSAYTYTASCSVICHVGATPVLCDTAPGSYEMDYAALGGLVTERTKAVIPVDIAGKMCDYAALTGVLAEKHALWKPANARQRAFGRVIILADAAHSLGATYQGRPSGSVADFTAFSFHAVKNLTTAEGGAVAWHAPARTRPGPPGQALGAALPAFDSEAFYSDIMLYSLHGQTKDALAKSQAASWEYDIAFLGWKCNMTDIQAALGLAQLERYPALLARRKELAARYEDRLSALPVEVLAHSDALGESSRHLMPIRIHQADEARRGRIIAQMAEAGIATNVHYRPLPMMSAYRDLGFDIAGFPHAYGQYACEITLPLHTLLADCDIDYIADALARALETPAADAR